MRALTRMVGVGDLSQVRLVGQRHLQRSVVSGQGLDRRGAQRGHSAETAEFYELFDPGVGDRATVPGLTLSPSRYGS
ncbi:hypothetical protein SB659_18230 [Arthrobacter sp. SIMBA_036]|uniref:hypothetical protein n=1 Tax=Arthrobacter sp. SIMBA_036 TaxID=3085778 RepID=UPI003979C2A0